jgi:hypothetical protein
MINSPAKNNAEDNNITWNFGATSVFPVGPRKAPKTFIDLVGRRTFRVYSDLYKVVCYLITRNLTLVPICVPPAFKHTYTFLFQESVSFVFLLIQNKQLQMEWIGWGRDVCIVRLVKGKKLKLSPYQSVEVHRAVRRRGSHIFLDNRLTDGGKVVCLTRWPPSTLRKVPDTHVC